MSDFYTLYNNSDQKQRLTPLLSLQKLDTPILSADKKRVEEIMDFLTSAKISVKLDNGLQINSIEILKGRVKPSQNAITKSIIQNFNIRSSYVATVDKSIIDQIGDFYHTLTLPEHINKPKIIFDASQEENLQKALHMTLATPLPKNTNLEQSLEQVNEEKGKTKKLTKSGRTKKITGYATVFMLGTIAAALLTFASVLIGIKILNP